VVMSNQLIADPAPLRGASCACHMVTAGDFLGA
jgi:hypothetical protein